MGAQIVGTLFPLRLSLPVAGSRHVLRWGTRGPRWDGQDRDHEGYGSIFGDLCRGHELLEEGVSLLGPTGAFIVGGKGFRSSVSQLVSSCVCGHFIHFGHFWVIFGQNTLQK